MTSEIYINEDPNDPTGILEYTLKLAVSLERAEKAIEKAVRSGKIHRHYGSDWFKEAVELKIVTAHEAEDLRELDELVNKVISVDQFTPEEVIPHYKSDKSNKSKCDAGD